MALTYPSGYLSYFDVRVSQLISCPTTQPCASPSRIMWKAHPPTSLPAHRDHKSPCPFGLVINVLGKQGENIG